MATPETEKQIVIAPSTSITTTPWSIQLSTNEKTAIQTAYTQEGFICHRILTRKERAISPATLEMSKRFHKTNGFNKPLTRLLIEGELATEKEIATWIAEYHGLQAIPGDALSQKNPDARSVLPDSLVRSRKVFPVIADRRLKTVTIAMGDPEQPGFNQVKHALKEFKVTWVVAQWGELDAAIDNQYIPKVVGVNDNEIALMVEVMLREAQAKGASDIHVNPEETITRIIFRIDGALIPWKQISSSQRDLFATQIKLSTLRGDDGVSQRSDLTTGGAMDVGRSDVPQDGRASRRFGSKKISLRYSSLPANFGETIVIRLLDQGSQTISLKDLGLLPDHHETMLKTAKQPHGILAMVGPTGSGKSTTLAAALKLIDPMDNRIISAEDPIEYRLRGVQQCQVTKQVKFIDILRAALRQDPDVLLIGEMRDGETANIAVTAANTGHLVLTTVHANTAILGITRLLNLDVTSDLLTATVRVLFAQRLVRKICVNCRTEHPRSKELVQMNQTIIDMAVAGGFFSDHEIEKPAFYECGPGCVTCGGSGYKGRTVLSEARTIIPEVMPILAKANAQNGFDDGQAEAFYAARVEKGELQHRTMRQDGVIKAAMGIVTWEDVLSETIEIGA